MTLLIQSADALCSWNPWRVVGCVIGPMDESALYAELCSLLRARGIEIRIEAFKIPPDSAGGLCVVAGKHLVLLHSGASKPERARALLEVVERLGLRQLGLSGADLSPGLLARLNRRGQMPWPHRSEAPSVAKGLATPPRTHLSLVTSKKPLAELTTMALGGHANRLESATSEEEVLEVARACRDENTPLYILGGGSNVIVADEGIDGTVLRPLMKDITVNVERGKAMVTVGAGYNWHDFVSEMTAQGYAGIECLGGIPGAVGATPIQNVGAYGQEVAQTISEVRVLSRRTLKISKLSAEKCKFSYRSSLFKTEARDEFIVLSVTFALTINGPATVAYGELKRALTAQRATPSLEDVFNIVVQLRRNKSMVYDPADENCRSCGSFFVNAQITDADVERINAQSHDKIPTFPGEAGLVKVPSAWLIERAGLYRGARLGPVGLSTKHTLSIVAHEGARAVDVVHFATHVREQVEETFGIRLVPEPNFWGFSDLNDGLPALKNQATLPDR